MDSQQQLQLEDAQKRLSIFKKHLDLLARCTGESKNIDANEVLSAVSELQSLVEWAAQQPELGAESAVLVVKLQELHQIRESLEKSSPDVKEDHSPQCHENVIQITPEKPESYSKDIEYITDIVTANFCDSCGDHVYDDDSFNQSCDKDSLCDFSASTEDQNVANLESPTSIDDTTADIIPNDEKLENVISEDNEYPRPKNHPRGSLNNEEIQQQNTDILNSLIDNKQEVPEEAPEKVDGKSPNLFRSEIVIVETDEDNQTIELNDSKSSTDPLDICMFAIRNLYESLRLKENELLKLSTMQNDQKHIEALQAVIIDFHKDITNLNNQLEISKKENLLLKEQVLELEEAENDARLEAQNLGQKLAFLQEKDSHSQAELSQLKPALKKSMEMLAEKEALEKELRSQIKYMETLVQKYEDQIKMLEFKDIATSQKLQELEHALEEATKKPIGCDKGTQIYPPSRTKIGCNGDTPPDNDDVERRSSVDQSVQVPEKCKELNYDEETTSLDLCIPSSSADETKDSQALVRIESISQRELLNRLHKLVDEDVCLQQQIHNVDQINLALWKKLQNLDTHIGECKRQNINETDPTTVETEEKCSSITVSSLETQPNDITTHENIPEESSNYLDQNELYIQERLSKLEEINASFEKELETRETISKEKEKKHEEWVETEKRLIETLKCLAEERDCMVDQITNLKRENDLLEKHVRKQEDELNSLKERNRAEISKIKEEQESVIEPLNYKVNHLLTKEKEILKMITNVKSDKSKNQDKRELERLKCSYIELQLELSNLREEIRKLEEQFTTQLNQMANKHLMEETQRSSELERLRNENTRCEKMVGNLGLKHKDLIEVLEKQKKYLQQTRENFKKNAEETGEEHCTVETELETHLHHIEEGTVLASTVLMEERQRVEKELLENIEDLRSKEEQYKSKIAELERHVIDLHEELHKMAAEPEPKTDLNQMDENKERYKSEKNISSSKEMTDTTDQNFHSEIFNGIPDPSLKSLKNKVEELAPTLKDQEEQLTTREKRDQTEYTEENVDELRAQVRELQSHLEKISGEVSEMPPVPSVKPTQPVKHCLGSQKLEDLDYAEVDECMATWRKSDLNETSKDTSPNFQGVYGEKIISGYGIQEKKTPVQEPEEENDYDEVLPRPTNFHVVQQVGSDTLLVGWNYVNPSILDGFEVYLDDHVHERIYIPDRTKALISGLNLRKPIRLSIYALSRYGQMSEPAVLDISLPHEINSKSFDDDDEYRDFEDPTKSGKRPYSMEW